MLPSEVVGPLLIVLFGMVWGTYADDLFQLGPLLFITYSLKLRTK